MSKKKNINKLIVKDVHTTQYIIYCIGWKYNIVNFMFNVFMRKQINNTSMCPFCITMG